MRCRGVGLDVLWHEPPDWSSAGMRRLLSAENLLLSPYCGMHMDAEFRALTKLCIDNVEAFLSGHPTNVVSRQSPPMNFSSAASFLRVSEKALNMAD